MALQEFTMKVVTFHAKFGHAVHPFNIWRKCHWLKTLVHITWLDILPWRLALVWGNFTLLSALFCGSTVELIVASDLSLVQLDQGMAHAQLLSKQMIFAAQQKIMTVLFKLPGRFLNILVSQAMQEYHPYKSNCHWLYCACNLPLK